MRTRHLFYINVYMINKRIKKAAFKKTNRTFQIVFCCLLYKNVHLFESTDGAGRALSLIFPWRPDIYVWLHGCCDLFNVCERVRYALTLCCVFAPTCM